ncbi:LytTR family DNA-binding domain-containing protein [Kordiimonas sp. SCSIO 12610]|uniref:LytR/AlgR family response regulator transcription factor n=1 Tax=Kordiimonas sp. SCSIO 12610 TaxID=2829597 RepID=UPI00210ACBF7|nr:LytTR family DNA-binding domain-containing protein [Kordiimonas sp. SCSIO 12610]UTW56163.1 LytTR family transcriptional regulator [Kordiimonas sp. SCSIO 12610]
MALNVWRDRFWIGAILWTAFLTTNVIFDAGAQNTEFARNGVTDFQAWEPYLWEASSAMLTLALIPLVLRLDQLFPLGSVTPIRYLAMHFAGSVAFSLIHVGGMVFIREITYFAIGGDYNFGSWPWGVLSELVYEYSKDWRGYLTILVYAYAFRIILEHYQSRGTAKSEQPAQEFPKLTVKTRDGEIYLNPDDIDYIEAAGNYLSLHIGDDDYLIRSSLKAISNRLPDSFQQVHRSYIVNTARITAATPTGNGDKTLTLSTGAKIPMSRRFRVMT